MNEISKRLIELADFFRVSRPSDFAKRTGLANQTATNYLKGERIPTVEALLQIQKAFEGLSLEWLLNGTGEMLISKVKTYADNNETKLFEVKDLEIDYLKQLVQSQKALIQVLSEKAGINLSDPPSDIEGVKIKESTIKGFRSHYYSNFRMMISNMKFNYQ